MSITKTQLKRIVHEELLKERDFISKMAGAAKGFKGTEPDTIIRLRQIAETLMAMGDEALSGLGKELAELSLELEM